MGKKYLDFNFVSDAIQAADFMRHLDRDVQSELSEWTREKKNTIKTVRAKLANFSVPRFTGTTTDEIR